MLTTITIRRRARHGLCGVLALVLLLPAGCATTIGGMVVKHVAMSAAKEVAKDQYDHYKKQKEADRKAAARKRSKDSRSKSSTQPANATDADSRSDVAP